MIWFKFHKVSTEVQKSNPFSSVIINLSRSAIRWPLQTIHQVWTERVNREEIAWSCAPWASHVTLSTKWSTGRITLSLTNFVPSLFYRTLSHHVIVARPLPDEYFCHQTHLPHLCISIYCQHLRIISFQWNLGSDREVGYQQLPAEALEKLSPSKVYAHLGSKFNCQTDWINSDTDFNLAILNYSRQDFV